MLTLSSLRSKLLFLAALATLPALLFAFFLADNVRTTALERIEEDALRLAWIGSREHVLQIRDAVDLLTWLGDTLAQEEWGGLDLLMDSTFLGALLKGHPQLANVGVLSPDGTVLASAYPLRSRQSWEHTPVFQAALASDEVVTGIYTISPIFEQPTLNHALAIHDADGQVSFVIFTGLEFWWLSDLAQQSGLGEEFTLLIADGEGKILAGADRADPRLRELYGTTVSGLPEIARTGHGQLLEMSGIDLRRYFVALPLAGLEVGDLYVVAGLPYDRVLQQTSSVFIRALLMLVALTFFTIASVFIATELSVLRGIHSLAVVVRRLGSGDLSARARIPKGANEMTSLAREFNAMADALLVQQEEAAESQSRLRALAMKLDEAREEEATRISRRLHDHVGQMLTSLKIGLARLRERLVSAGLPAPEESMPAIHSEIIDLNAQIETAIDIVRRISSELRPGVLDKLGLAAALQWQAREVEVRTDLVIQVEAEEIIPPPDELVSLALFRIVQEALTNVLRHANAHLVEVTLTHDDSEITLTVQDDGLGITEEAVKAGESLGIIGMHERVALINGRLSIEGSPEKGTTLTVIAPRVVRAEADDAYPAR